MPEQDLIAEGCAKLAAATPGPWSVEYDRDGDEYADSGVWPSAIVGPASTGLVISRGDRVSEICDLSSGDAELIVHMRNTYGQLLDELQQGRAALDDIARTVRPDDDGTWTDRDGLLESIGNTIETTGRKVWEVDTDD